jgi:hypothetical protein
MNIKRVQGNLENTYKGGCKIYRQEGFRNKKIKT